jgi:hypothetical protein
VILREAPQGVELLFLDVAMILGIVVIETINGAKVYFCRQF